MKPGDLVRIKLNFLKHFDLFGVVLCRASGPYFEVLVNEEVFYYKPDQVEVIAESGRFY